MEEKAKEIEERQYAEPAATEAEQGVAPVEERVPVEDLVNFCRIEQREYFDIINAAMKKSQGTLSLTIWAAVSIAACIIIAAIVSFR